MRGKIQVGRRPSAGPMGDRRTKRARTRATAGEYEYNPKTWTLCYCGAPRHHHTAEGTPRFTHMRCEGFQEDE